MAIKKKKRRKKRIPEPVEIPQAGEQEKPQYQDNFQASVGSKIEDLGSKLEGKGKNIMYGIAALAVLAILAGLFYTWNRRTSNAAQTALGRAIETSQAAVSEAPVPAASTVKTYKTEKERAEAAIKEFQAVAEKYGSPHKEKAQYFIAVNRMFVDRAAAVKELEAVAAGSGETAVLAKFALAQAKKSDGKLDEAGKLYAELAELENPVLSKDTVRIELAKIYEKQEKTKEAADIYFDIAKTASEIKDADDKPVPLSQTAREAKEKLEQLAPERAKEIKEPEVTPPSLPLGG